MLMHIVNEHWEAVAQIIVYVAVAVGLYLGLKNQVIINRKGLILMEKRMNDHEKSKTPHINCPVHQQAIDDITDRLDRIQGDISGVREDLSTLNKTLLLIATNTNRILP